MPDLDASFVLNYLHNPTPDDGVALDLLLHNDYTPLLDIDPEQTLDPTTNDPLTSTVPSPTNSQSSHASLPNIVVPYKNDRRSTTLHYDDRDYTLKYARKLKRESTRWCVSRTCSGILFVKTDSSRAEDDPGFYTVLKQHGHLPTCIPPPSTRVARSRVVRSSHSLTTRVAS